MLGVFNYVMAEDISEFEKWIKSKEARRGRKSEPKSNKRVSTKPKAKKPRGSRKPGFSEEIREQARVRAGDRCDNPLCARELSSLGGEHHCLPRSQYAGDDRNDLWNCAHICTDCHSRITSPTTDDDKRLRRYFERVAEQRRMGNTAKIQRKLRLLEKKLKDGTLSTTQRFQPFTK